MGYVITLHGIREHYNFIARMQDNHCTQCLLCIVNRWTRILLFCGLLLS